MANFYSDVPEIKFELENPLMERIVELKERNYRDKDEYAEAPQDFADAQENYKQVLDIVGDITANVIAPNAEAVDAEGPHCENGRVRYASKTYENMEAMVKAGMNGMTMPRKYNGLNLPITVYTAANEIVSTGDAGFENIWSLQDCIETLYEFGNEDQHARFIPRICAGETMSMDLTEPDAGSDLQSVMLKATFDEENNCWRLNGSKRFITNGDSDVHLVLARSEAGTRDGRGLSMFIYDKRDGGVDVRRIENKLGIHGSPTCELVYKNAKAELCGSTKLGLIKYVMALMNGARLGIAAQSVGLSQAAYNEAVAYANDRKQFGKAIVTFPAVFEMISNIKAKLDAGRALLYQTARYVDVYKALDDIARERKLTPEERAEQKKYAKLADAFTPLAKGMNSEYANQNGYDCIQVHGGSGFMLEYACQRIYRDARITSIYEGTTQLQVVAAIRYVTTGLYSQVISEFEQFEAAPEYQGYMDRIKAMAAKLNADIELVKAAENQELLDICARHLYEEAANTIMCHLLLQNATKAPELFGKSLNVYVNLAESEVEKHHNFIARMDVAQIESYRK
ncbi:MAG: acyl-CoA dehydrogenase family protein [Bacteroidaceae bacterium]|nr:acyl-CoA dehydrogenase family protein [Candidatus Minthousia equi]MCQ2245693.1 acyl-CoA dehydrogenase family protein [Bacteroidaceae bacterium]MDO4956369.1 Acyl-CoA dehydrogenase C-terminal domain-containing protein [Bacteroidales bacterium]